MKANRKQNVFGKTFGRVKRCLIDKGPTELRDAIILNLPAWNTVKYIER